MADFFGGPISMKFFGEFLIHGRVVLFNGESYSLLKTESNYFFSTVPFPCIFFVQAKSIQNLDQVS